MSAHSEYGRGVEVHEARTAIGHHPGADVVRRLFVEHSAFSKCRA